LKAARISGDVDINFSIRGGLNDSEAFIESVDPAWPITRAGGEKTKSPMAWSGCGSVWMM
jgi:hypothetical protein